MIPVTKVILGDEEKQALARVIDSGMLAQGPEVAKFEEEIKAFIGCKHALATSNGTTALQLALLAHGVGVGDEVICPAFTFIATATSIMMTGATPVFADIDPCSFNLSAAAVARCITPKTKAIMPVHLYGQAAELDALRALAAQHKLLVIEDGAQCVGASYKGKKLGSTGTMTLSLYATKNLASGEGGFVLTDDDAAAEAVKLMRQHGMRARYEYIRFGFNHRLTDLHAAVGRAQLAKLSAFTKARQANAAYFNAHIHSVQTPCLLPERDHIWHQYTVRVAGGKRDAFIKHLTNNGVGHGVYYPLPVNAVPFIAEKSRTPNPLIETQKACAEVVSLPVHAALTPAEREKIVSVVNSFFAV